MVVSNTIFMICAFGIILGGVGFVKTTIPKRARQFESEWLHGISKNTNLTEEEIMRPARIRDESHEAYSKMVIWSLKGLVIGFMARIVEGMLGL